MCARSSSPRRRPLQRRRPPLRAAGVPRGADVPPRRSTPRSRRGRALFAEMEAGLAQALERRRGRVGADARTFATAARAGRSRSSLPPGAVDRCWLAAGAFRGRARAALRRTGPARLAGRDPRAAAGRARRGRGGALASASTAQTRPASDARRASVAGSSRGAGAERRRRRGPEPGPLLVDEYDTTVVVPPAGRSGATPRPGRSCWSEAMPTVDPVDPPDRRQRARVDRGRDGDDDLPHRALDRRPRRHGLLGRRSATRRARRSRRR